ncbi:MAG: TIGR03032 family protein [Flavobacteriales bacterium]|nr:TIGR03032 family protein [Flavobacteriales bacterium]
MQLQPFSAIYSPQLPELLGKLKCSIVISTYQAGKVIALSPNEERNSILILPRTFDKPMGIAVDGNKMAISTQNEIITLANSVELAKYYPNKPNVYDNLWVPRATHYTGIVDMHDIAFGKDGIYSVNTSFSCICKVDTFYNFVPIWQPPFITQLASQDRCHLNGLVMKDGLPKYVTGLGQSDQADGWRDQITSGGFLVDIDSNEMIAEGLAMPHSPKLYQNKIYLLLSASGEFITIDPISKEKELIKKFDGFCRGLAIFNDFAFIGFSKLRRNSSTFGKLSFSEKANFSGIKVIHLPTCAEVAALEFQMSVDEIYEVNILENSLRPNILNTVNDIHKKSLSIPGQTFWAQ